MRISANQREVARRRNGLPRAALRRPPIYSDPEFESRMGRTPGALCLTFGRRNWTVSRIFASWNQLEGWLRQVEVLRTAA